MPEPRPVIITKAVQTCTACPSQWDAWTLEGQYLYLRYRGGQGTVHAFAGPDTDSWPDWMGDPDWAEHAVARFDTDEKSTWDYIDPNEMRLGEFCERAGIALALGLHMVPAIKAAWVEHFGGAA